MIFYDSTWIIGSSTSSDDSGRAVVGGIQSFITLFKFLPVNIKSIMRSVLSSIGWKSFSSSSTVYSFFTYAIFLSVFCTVSIQYSPKYLTSWTWFLLRFSTATNLKILNHLMNSMMSSWLARLFFTAKFILRLSWYFLYHLDSRQQQLNNGSSCAMINWVVLNLCCRRLLRMFSVLF